MQAPAVAVANWGQLIINITFFAIPLRTEFTKTMPTAQMNANLIMAAGIAPCQKPLFTDTL